MEKRVERLRYEVTFNPPGDCDCFYASAAKALGIETQSLKQPGLKYSYKICSYQRVTNRAYRIMWYLSGFCCHRSQFILIYIERKYYLKNYECHLLFLASLSSGDFEESRESSAMLSFIHLHFVLYYLIFILSSASP